MTIGEYRNIRFISLTETHLKPDIQNSEIHFDGFTPYRSDRIEQDSGGSMIYIHDSQPASEIMNSLKQALTEILDPVKNTTKDIKHLKPNVLIMGDFNFPRLQWPNGKLISGGTKTEQEPGYIIPPTHGCNPFKPIHPRANLR